MKILFVGNSYTYYNDMPAIFAELARENGHDISVDSVTKGGRKLYENLVEGDEYHEKIVSLCKKNQYDVLILQEQSYFALVDYEKFLEGLQGLTELVKARRVILYATWGRKSGCPLLEELGISSAEMTDRLADVYGRAAVELGAEISSVGKAFLAVTEADPLLDLYMPDLSHPSRTGSALAALVHYVTVFGEFPKASTSTGLLSETLDLLLSAIKKTLSKDML